MSGPKHTSGPWQVKGDDNFGYFVVAPSFHGDAYDSVILGDDEYREEGKERNKADATLVAAAPRLAEALRLTLAALISSPEGELLATYGAITDRLSGVQTAIDDARAALREAGVTDA